MRKVTKEYNTKSVEELQKEVQTLRNEIAKLGIEKKVKPEKDTNALRKKKKRLAVVLTLITQKQLGINS